MANDDLLTALRVPSLCSKMRNQEACGRPQSFKGVLMRKFSIKFKFVVLLAAIIVACLCVNLGTS